MNAHRHGFVRAAPQQRNDRRRDRLIVEKVNLCFVIRQQHRFPPNKSDLPTGLSWSQIVRGTALCSWVVLLWVF
jgi:hypothetical protein